MNSGHGGEGKKKSVEKTRHGNELKASYVARKVAIEANRYYQEVDRSQSEIHRKTYIQTSTHPNA